MRVGTVTAPFTDVVNVRVDGAIVQSFPEPAVAETDYTERVINLNAFANGASHALLFEYIGPSSGTGSYVIDDVSLIAGGACATPSPHRLRLCHRSPTVTPTATVRHTNAFADRDGEPNGHTVRLEHNVLEPGGDHDQ